MEEVEKVPEADPLTAEDSLGRAIILKGHEHAEHGNVLEDDKISKAGEDEKPQHTVALYVKESLFRSGSHFFPGDCRSRISHDTPPSENIKIRKKAAAFSSLQ